MNKELLLRLANHLEGGKFAYRWNFSAFRARLFDGVCGCAIGELAVLVKDTDPSLNTLLDGYGDPQYRYEPVQQEARRLLGLELPEFQYLFLPMEDVEEGQETNSYLTVTATPKQVAALIRDFVTSDGERYERTEDEQARHCNAQELCNDL